MRLVSPFNGQPSAGGHLTEAQLEDLLLDTGTAAAHDHLDVCENCRLELDRLRSALDSFNDLSLAWAEERAPQRITVPSRAAIHWHATPVWSALAAAVAGAAILVGAHQHQVHLTTAALTAEADAEASSVEEDNRLLLAIDQEIRLGQQSPVDPVSLGLSPKPTPSHNLEN